MVSLRLKGRDAWWTVLAIDPIAGPLVRLIAPVRWVTPNRLTLLSIALAVCAGVLFAREALVPGALVYQASFLVDCMDGKLAGVREIRNPWGNFVDQLGDHLRFLVCLAGLAYGIDIGSEDQALWVVVVAAYPCLRFTILVLGDARPLQRAPTSIMVAPKPLAIIRTARGRLTKPGTSVDSETLAFTLAPLAGQPLLGIAIAAAIDLIHVSALVWAGIRSAAGSHAAVVERPAA